MCQASLISNNIVRLSTRSYKRRLEAVAPNGCSVSRLASLNKELDNFYELLYSQWQSVTEKDYNVFGRQLGIMLSTLKDLLKTYKSFSADAGLSKEIERLDMNYAAISEVNSDIVNFRIKAPVDSDLKALMSRASNVARKVGL